MFRLVKNNEPKVRLDGRRDGHMNDSNKRRREGYKNDLDERGNDAPMTQTIEGRVQE